MCYQRALAHGYHSHPTAEGRSGGRIRRGRIARLTFAIPLNTRGTTVTATRFVSLFLSCFARFFFFQCRFAASKHWRRCEVMLVHY